jgi:hypothetical protein
MLLLTDINENRLYMEYGLFFFVSCRGCSMIRRLGWYVVIGGIVGVHDKKMLKL